LEFIIINILNSVKVSELKWLYFYYERLALSG